tara:strand:+ start:805 stop:1215 length:411 start_codon:yes stop_codon:yes gene_type:complete
MPLYDMDCPKCGHLPEEFSKVADRETCPYCKGKVTLRPTVFHTAGIIWSNQEKSSQLGKTFETNAQKREWLKQNPNVRQFSKGDAYDREHKEWVADECHKVAQKAGYADLKTMQKARKKEVAEKGNPRNLDKSPAT